MISQGEIWWADTRATGSEPGFRRPVLIVQGDGLNFSRIATVVCVPLTGNLRWAEAPGNVFVALESDQPAQDSIANVSQIITLDRVQLLERAGRIARPLLDQAFAGIDVVLGG